MEFARLGALFFIQWMALAAWMVPLTLILEAHGLQRIQPFAFATSAVAAFISPLFFGAMADRHFAPTRVLRWLSLATATALVIVNVAIQLRWNAWLTLGLIQVFTICASPTVSISTTIALSRIQNPRREFGPIRAMGTIGWMVGCLLISVLNADASTRAGFFGAGLWLTLAALTFWLPDVEPPKAAENLTWHERLGLDALTLLKNSDHRVVFLTACLAVIPLAAFYPYTPPHLRDLGMEHPSGWMGLGQTTEIAAMFGLGALLTRWRLKWILLSGLAVGLVRCLFCALNTKAGLLSGIALHGLTYTLFYTTSQIYVGERIDAVWRARAQALLTLMTSGVGSLLGYLGTGGWYHLCTTNGQTRWPLFWNGLALTVALVTFYFLVAYHGLGKKSRPPITPSDSPD